MNCEICENPTPITRHHIHSLSKGGKDKPYNKCSICPNCHALVHYGNIIIEGRFETTNGNKLIFRDKGQESISGIQDPSVWLYSEIKKSEDVKDESND